MNIQAPAGTYECAIKQIELGVDEIYIGGNTDLYDYFNFNARVKYNAKGDRIYFDKEELKEVVDYAHEHNVKVMYACNTEYLSIDETGSTKYLRKFQEYIDMGIEVGIDSLILADFGSILFLRKKGYKIPIIASTNLETVNKEQVYMLKEFGANRVVMSYQSTIEEIEAICKAGIMEVEVFGHDGCSFYGGLCNFTHSKKLGLPCGQAYQLECNGDVVAKGACLQAYQYCSVCSWIRLMSAGVTAIKLVGREGDLQRNLEISKAYVMV